VHNLTIDLKKNLITVNDGDDDPWIVHLLDTGLTTNTGGRVKQIAQFIGKEPFMLTYGDGVANINLPHLLETHQRLHRLVTVTAVHPPARFGEIIFEQELASSFAEKPQIGDGWINGGFFVLEPEIINYIDSNQTLWEGEPMEKILKEKQLATYKHDGFWQCMDSLRDVRTLENLWNDGNAPWKIW
jgi:glucose-1-phosphate cytidylyltransferase